jgi:putative MATE family efflux protein
VIVRLARRQLLSDRAFYVSLLTLSLPIIAQQLVMNALNAVDVLMIGQLGDTAVAAVGLANQVFFLMSLFLFGVGSGSVVFAAQFWGHGDLVRLRHTLGLALLIGMSGSALFSLVAIFAPAAALGLYTEDPAVIAAGSRYLQVVGLCYVPIAITTLYAMILRSTRNVKLPMLVSIGALTFKTVLAYGLIFGHFGLPALGILGAAIATCIARLLECITMLLVVYLGRLPVAARLSEMFRIERAFLGRFAYTALPVVVNEMLWSFGVTIYSGVYAHIGTNSIAATNIASTIEQLALVPMMGLGNSCAIMLGNYLGGGGDTRHASTYAYRFLVLAIAGGVLAGLLVFAISGPVVGLYQISPEAQENARRVLVILSAALWMKAGNMVMIVGILRSGGDTRFALFADTFPLWFIGVPLALTGGFVLHLPVYCVVLLVLADESTKFMISLWRVVSGRWIHSLVSPA